MSSIQLKKTNQKKKKKTTSLNTLPQESSIIHIGTVWATTQSPVRASVFLKKKIVLLYLELLSSEDHIPIFKDAQLLCLERGD
jgi:hypothetical protein